MVLLTLGSVRYAWSGAGLSLPLPVQAPTALPFAPSWVDGLINAGGQIVPQVDLANGTIVGCEALLRWLPTGGALIPPDRFIPVAEECGLILPLGHWVLLTACRQVKAWLDQGIDMGEMAVNISAHQFRQPEFVQSVRGILAETGRGVDCGQMGLASLDFGRFYEQLAVEIVGDDAR